ncbi:thromboxane-A synthase-like [Haemaphysalis longicornis]
MLCCQNESRLSSIRFKHMLDVNVLSAAESSRITGGAILFEEWIKKYGNIVGFYNGARPFLLINDLDILKKVLIEDFHNFSNRGTVIGVGYVPELENRMLINATGNRWKELRSILSPAFSPNKLSLMAGIISQCTDTLMEVLKEKTATGEAVEVTLPIRRATMDTMLKAGYGVDLNMQTSPPGGTLEYVATGVTKLLQIVPLHGIPFLSRKYSDAAHRGTERRLVSVSTQVSETDLEPPPPPLGFLWQPNQSEYRMARPQRLLWPPIPREAMPLLLFPLRQSKYL